ncbi:unnamed protein product [Alternaria alternata]
MENLVSSVNDILEKALMEVVEDDAPLNLRFITPYQLSTDWPIDENCSEYALTLPGELPPGQEYISVSYTWAHSQEIDASKPIPDYRIKDRGHSRRALQVNQLPHYGISPCMENTEDKERHLQIMDKIYEKSKRTVAILSKEVPDTMLSALVLVAVQR